MMSADARRALIGHCAMQGTASNYVCLTDSPNSESLMPRESLGVHALVHWGPLAESMNLFNVFCNLKTSLACAPPFIRLKPSKNSAVSISPSPPSKRLNNSMSTQVYEGSSTNPIENIAPHLRRAAQLRGHQVHEHKTGDGDVGVEERP